MAATSTNQTALRKRQQIAGANRTMFFWVAGASVLVGVALVIAILLFQKLVFNERVLGAKQKTDSTLSNNLSTVNTLKDNVRVLNTDPSLKSVMTADEQEPIQVILDALPSQANSAALGASLQSSFLNDPALKVQSITVDPVQGIESSSSDSSSSATSGTGLDQNAPNQNQITFHFVVGAKDMNTLKTLLQKLERSVRTFDITNAQVAVQNSSDSPYTLTVDGAAFYEPAMSVSLKSETIKP